MTQQNKFTPGPWRAPSAGVWGHGVMIAGCGGKQTVAGIRKLYKLSANADVGPIVAANARLIAAAPELYELLGKLLEGNGVCVHNQNPTEFPHTCYEPLICEEARRIKAAIDGE